MKISTSSLDPSKTKLDALLIAVPAFESTSPPWKKWSQTLSSLCDKAHLKDQFSGKDGSVFIMPTLGEITPSFFALVGLGKSNDQASISRSLGKAIRQLHQRHARSLGLMFSEKSLPIDLIVWSVEEATYSFRKFSVSPQDALLPLTQLVIFSKEISPTHILEANHVAEAVRYSRDLANLPPNLFYPSTFAEEARKLAKARKLHCTIWDERRLKQDGFGGILAVGQGSQHPPRFIRLNYRGGKASQAPYVVVGKAITFDTGGISIKPSDKMDEMKFDKCGGIATLGIMNAIAALRLPINVTGLIASAENMPSSTAYRPGDLVRSLSGKYIEVLNTDAEGRIVLADALTYAQRLKPKAIVDLATLTGACIVCFGHECAAVLGNQSSLVEQLRSASEQTCEKIWPLPLWPEYQEKVKSDIAFVKNTAGREGGTITGACFLNAFVDEKIPWAHLDIAGMAWASSEQPHRAKGATAFGVRLVTRWLQTLAK